MSTDPFAQLKSIQREGWALFAPLETVTTIPAAHLVKHARLRADGLQLRRGLLRPGGSLQGALGRERRLRRGRMRAALQLIGHAEPRGR